MTEIEHDYADTELLYNSFTEPSVEKALKELKKQLPENPRILDAGCGPGSHLQLFEDIFPDAEVVAADVSQPHLNRAREKAEKLDIPVEFVKTDLTRELPFDRSFDLVWFGDVICPSDIQNPVMLLKDIIELLDEDGVLAVFYGNWLRQMFMPGYARLEHKVNAAYELMHETKNLNRSWQGPDHPEKAVKWFQEAGLSHINQSIHSSTYRGEDITPEALKYVKHVLKNDYTDAVREKGSEAGLTEEEKRKFHKLSDPESVMYLPEKDDYYCSMNCILTYGTKR